MDNVRRCRRCKRKRLDDEPPEVQQYKTCAKCRIIERNKKNSRKPLAEETMLYGLKQFKEQSLTGNYMEEEGLLKDDFFRKFHNKPFNYEAELHQVLSNPNYTPPVLTMPPPSTKDYSFKSSSVPLQFNNHSNQNQSPQSHLPPPQQPHQQSQSATQPHHFHHLQSHPQYNQQAHSHGAVSDRKRYDEDDDIYTELTKLGNDRQTNDASDEFDPYSYDNVYDEYQKFLLAILKKRNFHQSINNLVYLKEFDEEFTFNLSRTDSTNARGDNSRYSAKVGGEKQFRAILLNNLKANYIEPIIAVMNVPYNQVSSNLNDFKNSSSIKSYHNFIYNENSSIAGSNNFLSKIRKSSIYLNYDRRHNLLIIKVNFNLYEISKFKYSADFKQKVVEAYKKLSYEKSLNNSVIQGRVGYNVATAQAVYDRLMQEEIETFKVDRASFIGDFINFEKVFVKDEDEQDDDEDEDDGEGDDDEDDDEDEDDDDDDDDDDDQDMDDAEIPADMEIISPVPVSVSTNGNFKESMELDPAFET